MRLGRPTVSALLLIGVWTLITTLATLRGGVASIGPAFLVIPICAAGLLIDGVASLSLAALATVLVGSLAWMERFGLYTVSAPQLPLVTSPFPLMALPLITAGIWIGLFWTVALLTWLLAGGLQRALTAKPGAGAGAAGVEHNARSARRRANRPNWRCGRRGRRRSTRSARP